jgi:metal-responsive CopG/Arc/MetJ family transcriptional regulator
MAKKRAAGRKYTTITIPSALFAKLQGKIENTGFSSVSEYITFILREMLLETENKKGKKGNNKETADLVDKLRKLGYA